MKTDRRPQRPTRQWLWKRRWDGDCSSAAKPSMVAAMVQPPVPARDRYCRAKQWPRPGPPQATIDSIAAECQVPRATRRDIVPRPARWLARVEAKTVESPIRLHRKERFAEGSRPGS